MQFGIAKELATPRMQTYYSVENFMGKSPYYKMVESVREAK